MKVLNTAVDSNVGYDGAEFNSGFSRAGFKRNVLALPEKLIANVTQHLLLPFTSHGPTRASRMPFGERLLARPQRKPHITGEAPRHSNHQQTNGKQNATLSERFFARLRRKPGE